MPLLLVAAVELAHDARAGDACPAHALEARQLGTLEPLLLLLLRRRWRRRLLLLLLLLLRLLRRGGRGTREQCET